MRLFAQRQNQPQKHVSSSAARSNTAIGPTHHANPLPHLQHTMSDQAGQRMLHTHAEKLEAGSLSAAASYFAQDFSRIPIQRKATNASTTVETAPPITHEVLRSSGQPLDPATRAFMEPRFGRDFSQVRVHIDSQAATSARDVDALAYTVGRDIVFAQGQFAPHTVSGQRLLAHELTHTIQQSAGAEQAAAGDLRVGQRADPFEDEAEKVSTSVLAARVGESPQKMAGTAVQPDGSLALRRKPNPDAGAPEDQPLRTVPPKEEGGTSAPPPAEVACKPPTNIALPCTPKGLSDADFMKTGAPKEAFGFTQTLSKQAPPPPEVRTKPAGKSKQVVVEKTQATPIPCESFFTKAGSVWRIISLDADKPKESANAEKCGSSYQRQFTITAEGEKKISEMEMEHCVDFKYAFDISLGCYAAVVNDLAKKGTEFDSQAAAVDAVTKRTGRKPDTWMAHYLELLAKTAERDTRKWHTAVEPKGPGLELEIDRRGHCKSRSPTEINERSFPEVGKGKHPSSDIIQ